VKYPSFHIAALGLVAFGAISVSAAPTSDSLVAIKAGKIHTLGPAGIVEDAVMIVRDGRVVSVTSEGAIPPGTQIVDYGDGATIIPGLVSASSGLARGFSDPRTAAPGLSAVDNFDFFANRISALASGVTSTYIDPATSRLITGTGAVVKLGGEGREHRIVNGSAAIDGSVSSDAYRTPGFWAPPVPATVDVGMGQEAPQLPHSLQGAIFALEGLLAGANGVETEGFGPYAVGELKTAIQAGSSWRFTANSEEEIRAVSRFAGRHNLNLLIDGGRAASTSADLLASAGVGVVFEPAHGLGSATNWGTSEDSVWPTLDVPAALLEAGVPVAIAPGSNHSINSLWALAVLSSQGNFTNLDALRAVTLTPAEMLGAADRVGSLGVGMDADFVVLNGAPMVASTSIKATWVDGELVFTSPESGAVVLKVDELFIGNGEVLRPGQLLMNNGRIVEVGEVVAHPKGAVIVHGAAAMPGIVDALGYLGLEGSRRAPSSNVPLSRILDVGGEGANRVAKAGVTTVVLSPQSLNGNGTTMLAYKPAAAEFDDLIVEEVAAVRLTWSSSNRYNIGENVKGLLERAVKYRADWAAYHEAMASWTPPAPKAEESDDESDDEADGEEPEAEEKDSKKKKKKEKDLDPMSGVWNTTSDWGSARFQFSDAPSTETTELRGSMRSDALSENLLRFEGTYDHDGNQLEVSGIVGGLHISAELDDEKLAGTITFEGAEYSFEAERESRGYTVAGRSEDRKPEAGPKDPKGMPKEPKFDAYLDPLARAMDGNCAVIVDANRDDEILDCVAAFEAVGIKPVLLGAADIHKVMAQVSGRIAGVLPNRWPLRGTKGIATVNRFAELQEAGIPVAFYSAAEEGAGDLLLMAAYAVVEGMSPNGALKALTSDAATLLSIDDHVGRLEVGLDADVLLLDRSPMEVTARVQRTWVLGREVL
jgi:imidazolonepropionase-like amidohydrolase